MSDKDLQRYRHYESMIKKARKCRISYGQTKLSGLNTLFSEL